MLFITQPDHSALRRQNREMKGFTSLLVSFPLPPTPSPSQDASLELYSPGNQQNAALGLIYVVLSL